MRSPALRFALGFVFFVLLQGVVFKNIILFEHAFCFIYIYFLLNLPVDTRPVIAIPVGFAMGLSVDMFYNTSGMHAAASVLVMFLRDRWLNLITPQGGFEIGASPTIKVSGVLWYIGYALPIILIHQLMLFYIESYGFGMFWFTFYKVILSTMFTFIMCVVLQVLFIRR